MEQQKIKPVHRLSCHCGNIKIDLKLPKGLVKLRRCDCSMCRRRGAIVASVPLDDITYISGEHDIACYQFNTKTAKHYFCNTCGIYTHHQRRSDPTEYGFNVGCLEDINPYLLGDIPVLDGVNHPADRE